jgi:hypothetical protein
MIGQRDGKMPFDPLRPADGQIAFRVDINRFKRPAFG